MYYVCTCMYVQGVLVLENGVVFGILHLSYLWRKMSHTLQDIVIYIVEKSLKNINSSQTGMHMFTLIKAC